MAKNWIAGAIKHPGALHKEMGVPQGQKIPAGRLAKAAKAGGTLGKRARLAETLKGFSHLPKGVALTPTGDIGAHRGKEAKELGTFKNTPVLEPSENWARNEPRVKIDRRYEPGGRARAIWHPVADSISPEAISGPGNPGGNMAGDEGLAPKKNSPLKNYAPITKPPLGRALLVRGEHNQNDRVNSQAK